MFYINKTANVWKIKTTSNRKEVFVKYIMCSDALLLCRSVTAVLRCTDYQQRPTAICLILWGRISRKVFNIELKFIVNPHYALGMPLAPCSNCIDRWWEVNVFVIRDYCGGCFAHRSLGSGAVCSNWVRGFAGSLMPLLQREWFIIVANFPLHAVQWSNDRDLAA